jgi:hypothetical protein
MKKDDKTEDADDLRPEYDLSQLRGGVRGKYLDSYRAGTNLALLNPEIRAAFCNDEALNRALRFLMASRDDAKSRVLNALQDYLREGQPQPSVLHLPVDMAWDLCRLGRDEIGPLSEDLIRGGPRVLEEKGLFGLRVVLEEGASAPSFESSR